MACCLIKCGNDRTLINSYDLSHGLVPSVFSKTHLTVSDIQSIVESKWRIPPNEQRLVIGGKDLRNAGDVVLDADSVSHGPIVVEILLRLLGGKGGFGANLRHAAARIGVRRIKNFDAMRDLYGRRLRHVNYTSMVAEWRKKKEEEDIQKRLAKKRKMETEKQALYDRADANADKVVKSSIQIRESTSKAVEDTLKRNPNALINAARSSIAAQKTKKPVRMEKGKSLISGQWDVLDDYDFDEWLSSDEEEEEEGKTGFENADEFEEFCEYAADFLASATVPESDEPNEIEEESIEETVIVPITTTTTTATTTTTSYTSPIDLESLDSIQILDNYDMDTLKFELERRRLKCGGTKQERMERLWSIRGVKEEDIDPVLRSGGKSKKKRKKQ